MSSPYERLYPECRFGGYTAHDGAVAFYCRVQALADKEYVICDFGCGRGFHKDLYSGFTRDLQILRGKVTRVIGVDVDEYANDNSYIDEFRLIDLADGRIPMDDASVDLVVTEWVVEHLPDPLHSFSEIRRILKPGGYVCLRTPNLWHYSCLGALMIPDRFHTAVRRMLKHPHESEDVFPTLYRCNTVGRLKSTLSGLGFDTCVLRHRGPSHFTETGSVLGFLGEMIERVSPQVFKAELHGFARKSNVGDAASAG